MLLHLFLVKSSHKKLFKLHLQIAHEKQMKYFPTFSQYFSHYFALTHLVAAFGTSAVSEECGRFTPLLVSCLIGTETLTL